MGRSRGRRRARRRRGAPGADRRAGPAAGALVGLDRRDQARPLHRRAAGRFRPRPAPLAARPVPLVPGPAGRPGVLVGHPGRHPRAALRGDPGGLRRRRRLPGPARETPDGGRVRGPRRRRPRPQHGRLPRRHPRGPARRRRPHARLRVEPHVPHRPARPCAGRRLRTAPAAAGAPPGRDRRGRPGRRLGGRLAPARGGVVLGGRPGRTSGVRAGGAAAPRAPATQGAAGDRGDRVAPARAGRRRRAERPVALLRVRGRGRRDARPRPRTGGRPALRGGAHDVRGPVPLPARRPRRGHRAPGGAAGAAVRRPGRPGERPGRREAVRRVRRRGAGRGGGVRVRGGGPRRTPPLRPGHRRPAPRAGRRPGRRPARQLPLRLRPAPRTAGAGAPRRDAAARYLAAAVARGRRLGDVKVPALEVGGDASTLLAAAVGGGA